MSKKTIDHFANLLHEMQVQHPKDYAQIIRWGSPLEINSGAISLPDVHGNVLDVQANTTQGLWDLYGVPKAQVDERELCEFLQNVNQRHSTPPSRWGVRSVSIVTHTHASATSVPLEHPATIDESVVNDDDNLDDWRSSPSDLLAKLLDKSTNRDELFDAVLFAEIAKFDGSQIERLLERLFTFVSEYRFSQDEDVKTAVGAAIRKLAMNLQDAQIEQYADLFLPTETDTLSCEIELELAKGILWRLTATPVSSSLEFPKLESHLAELATDYLKPRLILQKNYASVAIQAALGVLLLNGPHAGSVLKSVKDLGIVWFAELFQRRLGRLRKQLGGNAKSTDVAPHLAQFELELQSA